MPIEIISESKREVVKRARPANSDVHPWCPEEEGGKPLFYATTDAIDAMFSHCLSEKDSGIEVMGLLVGELFNDDDGQQYGIIRDTPTSELDSDSISVRFADFSQLMKELDQLDYDWILLGWYHSHPGHTCFLSATDIDTHTTMFKHDHQVAIVIDPVNIEAKSFIIRDKRVVDIPLMVLGKPKELDGIPLHHRMESKITQHGGAEPTSQQAMSPATVADSTASNPSTPSAELSFSKNISQSNLFSVVIGSGIAIAPLAYQLITNNLQPHWFNPPTVVLGLIGYLIILNGLKNNLAPLLEIIDDATGYGTLIFFYGLSSAIGLLLLGTWRLMTNAWENHFILFAMLMGFVTLLGANAVGQSKS